MHDYQNSPTPIARAIPLAICTAVVSLGNPAQAQGIDGFYATTGNKVGFNHNLTAVVELGIKGLWLQPDGRFAQTESGMAGDFNAYCDKYPKNCGRYEISNGQYTSWKESFPDNPPKTASFAQNEDELIIGENRYQKIYPVSDLRLEGDYSIIGSGRTVHSFSQDGSYVRTFKDNVRTGNYKIDGYTIIFSLDDGETETEAFFTMEDWLVMDSKWYEKLD